MDDIININEFDPRLLKLDKKESIIGIDIYYIGYITVKDEYKINSVNPLYFYIKSVEGYVEKINDSDDRSLIITVIDNNDDNDNFFGRIGSVNSKNIVVSAFDVLHKIYDTVENKIGSVKLEDRNKFRFNSDVVLPFNTPMVFKALTIVFRCIIMKDGLFYPDIYVDDGLVVV